MSTKHTTGPWMIRYNTVETKLDLRVVDKNEKRVCEFPDPIYATAENGIKGERESKANARLIAAAPELLSRLEDCAHQLRQAWACIEHIKEHAPDYERKASIETLKAIQMVGNDAEAAIAKAKGEG